jgi:hypothetical protein
MMTLRAAIAVLMGFICFTRKTGPKASQMESHGLADLGQYLVLFRVVMGYPV